MTDRNRVFKITNNRLADWSILGMFTGVVIFFVWAFLDDYERDKLVDLREAAALNECAKNGENPHISRLRDRIIISHHKNPEAMQFYKCYVASEERGIEKFYVSVPRDLSFYNQSNN